MDKDPDPIDDEDNPEWTAEDFARARPFKEVFPEQYKAWKKRAADAERAAVPQGVLDQEKESFATAAARLRACTPAQTTDASDLIGRDRDSNYDTA